MAFQLKNMLGHMIRPKQQAVAIASNNTDQMFYGAMAPVSPTMLQQQTSHQVSNNAGNGLGYVDYQRHQQSQHQHQQYSHHNHNHHHLQSATSHHQQQFNDTPFGKSNSAYHHHHITAQSTNMPHHNQQQTNAAVNNHFYGSNSSRTAFYNSTTPTAAQPYRNTNQQATPMAMPMPMRKGVQGKVGGVYGQNSMNSTNKKTSIEQQYFENEAEAQAWEDHCLGNHLEAPAPKKFLQNVAVKVNKSTAPTNTAGKKIKQKATNIITQTAQPISGSTTDKTPINANASDSAQQKAPIGEQSFKMKFKTEICKFWQLSGTCEYSDSCSFAHGSHELKQRTDQPRNYKTKQCKRFHKELYCPYGARCQFLHDEEATTAPEKKKVKLDNNMAKIDNSATKIVSYTHLLKNVIETEAATAAVSADWPEPLFEKDSATPAAPSQNLNLVEPVLETQPSSNRRLQVFANIPESLGESLPISLE